MTGRRTPPLVGISCYRERATWGVWHDVQADLLHADYADMVTAAGGLPVLLPCAPTDPERAAAAEAVVARLDALVIAGGADVGPQQYGAVPHAATVGCRPDRDAWELALVAAADSRGLPLLGVCRGMQVMAVAAGGSLVQHLPDVVGTDAHSPGADRFGATTVTLNEGSRVAHAVGTSTVAACHHHQIVERHPGFAAVGHASDGTLEAMERSGDRFCVAVQWHPERSRDPRLFAELVRAAQDARS